MKMKRFFGLGGGSGTYRDLETSPFPLSAQDDDDDEEDGMPLPPYSDAPPSERPNGCETPSSSKSGAEAIAIRDGNSCDYGNGNDSSDIEHLRRCCGGRRGFDRCGPDGSKCGRRTKRLLMAMFYLALLMVIVLCASGIGYIIAQDGSPFRPDEATLSGASDEAGVAKDKAKVIANGDLPPPPSNLHDTCTDWITASGREKCQADCDAAKCCALSATDKGSCWVGHARDCAQYRAACMALELHSDGSDLDSGDFGDGGAQVPREGGAGGVSSGGGEGSSLLPSAVRLDSPQSSNLDQWCSPSSLSTPEGFEACSESCRPSRCCKPEIYGCEVNSGNEFCRAYETPCATVAESWRGSGHAVPADQGTATAGQQQDTVANSVMIKCNSANINPPDECMGACYPAACCYKSTSYPPIEELFDLHYRLQSPFHTVTSCSNNVGFCQQYGACEHLNHLKDTSSWDEEVASYELDISKVCRAEYVAQFGALECSNVCQPAHCCFSGEYLCEDVSLGHLACADYNACAVLYPGYKSPKELFEMAKEIDKACSEDSLGSGKGRSNCQLLCKDRLCCFEGGAYGCENDPSMHCLAFAGCHNLVSTPTDYINQVIPVRPNSAPTAAPTEQVQNGGGVEEEVDVFVMALELACSETSLKTLEGIQQCHNKCQTHLCCFTSEPSLAGNDCSDVHVEACNAYKPCERLVTPNAQNPPSSISTGSAAPTGWELDKIADDVERACALPDNPYMIDQSWVTGCHTACASRFCCLVDSRIGSNCRATVGTRECNAYAPCEVLINNDGEEMTSAKALEDKFGDIEMLCNDAAKESSELFDKCKERCNQRSCCFEEERAYSCYHMEKDWCEEFNACSFANFAFLADQKVQNDEWSGTPNLINPDTGDDNNYAIMTNQNPSPGTIESLCAADNLNENYSNCKNLCASYQCCFDTENNCWKDKITECSKYVVCEAIFRGDPTSSSENKVDFLATSAPTVNPTNVNASGPQAKNGALNPGQSFEDLCSGSNYIHNWDSCKTHCSPYECCSRRTDSCYERNRSECDYYAVCAEFCTDEEKCTRRDSLGGGVANENKEVSVNTLSTPEAIPQLDNFQSTLEAACSAESLKSLDGIEKCFKRCQAFMCCFPADAKEMEFDCSDAYPEQCNEHAICEQLVSLYDLWKPPSKAFDQYAVKIAVNDACIITGGSSRAMVSEEFVAKCHQVCEARLCCLTDSVHGGCVKFLGRDECNDYAACQVLVGPGDSVEASIDDVCNSEVLTSKEFFTDCRDMCKTRSCCFEDLQAYSCYEMEKDWCDKYEACKLVGYSFFGTGTHDEKHVDIDLEDIDTKCSNAYMGAFGVEECEYLCDPLKCCFDFSECSQPNQLDCGKASACGNFYQPKSQYLILEKLCSEEELENNQVPCQDICDPYECCFFNTCSAELESECAQYESCSYYYEMFGHKGLKQSASSPSNDINSAINSGAAIQDTSYSSSSSNGQKSFKSLCTTSALQQNWEICKTHCQRYECCYLRRNSCYKDDSLECDEYAICEEFFFDKIEDETEDIENDSGTNLNGSRLGVNGSVASPNPNVGQQQSFKTLCEASTIEKNWDTCKLHCSRFECCFAKENTCYNENSLECDEYAICEEFFFDEFELEREEPEISEGGTNMDGSACESSSFRQSNWDTCKSKCEQFECCFINDSCYNTNQIGCDQHYYCEDFFVENSQKEEFSNKAPDATNSKHVQLSFKTLCTPSTIGKNWGMCKDHCSRFECCFSSENPCYEQKHLECDEYYICEEFYLHSSPEPNSPDIPPNSINRPGPAVESSNIDSLDAMKYRCSPAHLQDNLNDCEEWCIPHECCFFFSNSCYSSNKKQCDAHHVCEAFFEQARKESYLENAGEPPFAVKSAGTTSVDSSDSDSGALIPPTGKNEQTTDEGLDDSELLILARACNEDRIRTDATECKMLCQGSACCFRGKRCSDLETFCKDHAMCSSMFDN